MNPTVDQTENTQYCEIYSILCPLFLNLSGTLHPFGAIR